MQICDKQYQSLNISASPSFASAQGRENERRGWTKETYDAKNKEPGNRYDWSRKHLNFEIRPGRKMVLRNGKTVFTQPVIARLGTQRQSLKERYEQRLKELDYKPWAKDAPNQPNTCIDFVFSGDHDRMTEIAFGKPMDLDWRKDNSKVTLADNTKNSGQKQIEAMAWDYYGFLCRHFGEENVIGLECHLDETTPHFHALVIPVAMRAKRGRVGGYELKTDAKRAGKERLEHITTRQFTRLTEDEQKMYQPAEQKMVPSVSYSYYFGETKFAARQSYKQWHTMLFEEVGEKWGLQRGEDTSLMTAEERKEHRKKSKRQLERERLQALELAEVAKKEAEEAAKIAEETTRKKIEVQHEKSDLERKVKELAEAVGNPNEVADVVSFDRMVFSYNPDSDGAIIANLKAKGKAKASMMDVIRAAFEEMDKVKARRVGLFGNSEEFRKKQADDIRSIMTDMQTILRHFASIHAKELAQRSRAIVKQERRSNAIAIRKIQLYDEMVKKGISVESYDKAKEKADKFDKARSVVDTMWKGAWEAVEVISDPKLDEYTMNDNKKDTVRKALSQNPLERLKETGWLLKMVGSIREIKSETETEVWEIGAEKGVDYLKRLGLDMTEGVAEYVDDMAAATACLFFGYLDAATNIAETCDGGGGNNELPKKKDDEDELAFARRCHQMAKTMFVPRYRLKR